MIGFKYEIPALLIACLTIFALVVAPAPSDAEEVLHRGTWDARGFDVDGTWKIVRDGGQFYLILDPTFSTKSAPDLKIYLSSKAAQQIDNRNATEDTVLVARLESNRGAQRYPISERDLSRFKALVLHNEKYSKLWAVAILR